MSFRTWWHELTTYESPDFLTTMARLSPHDVTQVERGMMHAAQQWDAAVAAASQGVPLAGMQQIDFSGAAISWSQMTTRQQQAEQALGPHERAQAILAREDGRDAATTLRARHQAYAGATERTPRQGYGW